MWTLNRIVAAVVALAVLIGAASAQRTVTPQIGGGIGSFDGGISKNSAPPTVVCGGYQGPGDIAGGALIGVSIRAWAAANCGQKFANVCVSGVCADMLTSSSTGALVPQTINATLCPAASTSICVVNKWYDQTAGNHCSAASCDMVQSGANQRGILTTTCPPPLTVCVLFPVSGGTTVLQSANNLTLVPSFTVMTFASFSGPGTGSDYSTIFNNSGTIAYSFNPNQLLGSCDGVFDAPATYTNGTWVSGLVQCTSSVQGFYINGTSISSTAWTPTSTAYPPLVGAVVNGAAVSMTEMGIWPTDVSSNAPSLNTNQNIFYGLTAPLDTYIATAGNDLNPCSQASPCATIAKVNALHYSQNYGIHFNGGDTFNGCLSLTTANATPTVGNPITVNGYGTGRPKINTNCSSGFSAGLTLDTVRGVNVSGIDFTQGGNSPPTYACVLIINTAGAVQSGDYAISNITCTGGFTSQGGNSGTSGGGIIIRGFTGGCAAINNVSIQDITVFGAAVTSPDQNGVFTSDGCTASLGGNLNNWLVQGSLFFNLGGTNPNTGTNPGNGVLLTSGTTGLQQFNLAHDNAWNCTVSPGCGVGFWYDAFDQGVIQFSECYNMQPGFTTAGTDFDCVDHDQGVTNTLFQYVFSHDNYGYGSTGVQAGSGAISQWGPNTLRYSIFENDNKRTGDLTAGLISYFNNGTPGLLYIYNNTIWANHTTSPTRTAGYANQSGWPSGGYFANNSISLTADSFGLFTPVACVNVNASTIPQVFNNNDYNNLGAATQQFYTCGPGGSTIAFAAWQAAIAGGDASTIQTAPGFVGAPPDVACTWTPSTQRGLGTWPPSGCAASVALASGAQNAKSAGANLSTTGVPGGAPTRDFFASVVPGSGPCYNIGAYGGCP